MKNVAFGFRDADGAILDDLVHCLDFNNGLPFFRAYKAHSWDSLRIRDDQNILDVACGIGFDVIELAKLFPLTTFFGVDLSAGFLDIARSRAVVLPNVCFLKGNSEALPFPDGHFDGVRIDRSLQHMKKPHAAIREMVRVTRPDGRIVATEPDWGTFVLFNGEFDISASLARQFRGSFRNPCIGRKLGVLFKECGIRNLQCVIHALCVTDFTSANVVFDLARVRDQCVELGVMTGEDTRRWWRTSEEASQSGSFLACLNIVEFNGHRDRNDGS